MGCVPWGSNPGGPLGVWGTNVIPTGCVGAPCQTSCADSYVKLIDITSAVAGVVVILTRKAWGKLSWLALVVGGILLAFSFLSYSVLPAISIPWVTGPISANWY